MSSWRVRRIHTRLSARPPSLCEDRAVTNRLSVTRSSADRDDASKKYQEANPPCLYSHDCENSQGFGLACTVSQTHRFTNIHRGMYALICPYDLLVDFRLGSLQMQSQHQRRTPQKKIEEQNTGPSEKRCPGGNCGETLSRFKSHYASGNASTRLHRRIILFNFDESLRKELGQNKIESH